MPVRLIETRRFADDRGWFMETWNARRDGVLGSFVQDNHSLSVKAGTLRGIHFQRPPHAQAKLVRCLAGAIYDVAVDLRAGSPTYGRWVGAELSAENGRQLFVPEGFGHGFITLLDNTEVAYKCSDLYAPECDGGIRWNDPDLGIGWPRQGPVTLSDKDQVLPLLAEWTSPFPYDGQPLEAL